MSTHATVGISKIVASVDTLSTNVRKLDVIYWPTNLLVKLCFGYVMAFPSRYVNLSF